MICEKLTKIAVKKYVFSFDAKKDDVIQRIMNGVRKRSFCEFEKDVIYGRLSKDKSRIYLFHGIPYRNSLRPVFTAKIKDGEKTVLSGKWRLSVFDNVFFAFWYLFLIFVAFSPFVFDGEGNLVLLYAVVALFAAFGVLFIKLGCWIERKRMNKVIGYLEEIQADFNQKT